MPSQRNTLETNLNESKNTRMEMTESFLNFDLRKDELMHVGRYFNAAQTLIDLSKKLGRPLRVLDIGCGEMNTVRLLYKSFTVKKTEVIESYTGLDIDYKMKERAFNLYGKTYESCNADILIQDLTVNPKIDVEDGYYDLVICFEFCEHVKTEFLPAILKEAYRVLNPEGTALFSTPNSNGSNSKLPADHVYEYSWEEMNELFKNAGFTVEDSVGTCINISRIPTEEKEDWEEEIERVYKAFGRNTAFSSVALAPLFDSKNCKNVLYTLKKDEK